MEEVRKKKNRLRTKRPNKSKEPCPHNHELGLLEQIFCPLEHNNHSPHLLRGMTLLIISLVAVFSLGVSFARHYFLRETVLGQEIVSSVLIDLANETRLKYGETPLIRNKALETAASLKAEDMATYEYFAHNSPTGVTPWYWLKEAGYDFLYAGENLAVDFTQSKDVNDAWLKSPTHKANIISSKFKEIGISVKEGRIDGHNTVYVVQMFGTQKDKKVTPYYIAEEVVSPHISLESEEETPFKEEGEVAGIEVETLKQEDIEESIKSALLKTSKDKSPLAVAITKAGAAVYESEEVESDAYITLLEEDGTIFVIDKGALEDGKTIEELMDEFSDSGVKIVKYASFWQKLIYNFWYGLNTAYKIIMAIISAALVFLFMVEFKRKHWLHMLYGLLTIALLLLLLYLNQHLL